MQLRRPIAIGFIASLVLAMTLPVFAKGAYQVTLTGGGQEVTVTGNGEPHTNTVFSSLAESVQLYDGLWVDGDRVAKPTGDLGPKITALWLFIGPAEDIPIVQYLYPFAAGGPVGHIPGGQMFIDDPIEEAWFVTADGLTDDLAAVGFDTTLLRPTANTATTTAASAAVVVGEVAPVAQAEAPFNTDSAWSPLWALGFAGAVIVGVLVARSGFMRRRNQRPAGRTPAYRSEVSKTTTDPPQRNN